MKAEIVALIKDELQDLEEWIIYHLMLGFDRLVLYEDYRSMSHTAITSGYPQVILTPLADIRKEVPNELSAKRQVDILNFHLSKDRNEFDWLAFIDVDEYVFLEEQYSLHSFLDEYKFCPGVILYWKFMSANKHIKRPKNGIVQSYTEPSSNISRKQCLGKSLFNLKKQLGTHYSHHFAKYGVTTDKKCIIKNNFSQFTTYNKAWINHYFTKSWEDWCYQIYSRGDTKVGNRRLLDFFDYNENMLNMKDELISAQFGKKPCGTIFLDQQNTLLFTGQKMNL